MQIEEVLPAMRRQCKIGSKWESFLSCALATSVFTDLKTFGLPDDVETLSIIVSLMLSLQNSLTALQRNLLELILGREMFHCRLKSF